METKYLSCAETAKLVRATLKKQFPGVKFTVRSDTYAGGASIRVGWLDGPTEKDVKAQVGQYECSTFDPMIDLKSCLPPTLLANEDGTYEQVSYGPDWVFCNRNLSPEFEASIAQTYFEEYGAQYDREAYDSTSDYRYGCLLRETWGPLWKVAKLAGQF